MPCALWKPVDEPRWRRWDKINPDTSLCFILLSGLDAYKRRRRTSQKREITCLQDRGPIAHTTHVSRSGTILRKPLPAFYHKHAGGLKRPEMIPAGALFMRSDSNNYNSDTSVEIRKLPGGENGIFIGIPGGFSRKTCAPCLLASLERS